MARYPASPCGPSAPVTTSRAIGSRKNAAVTTASGSRHSQTKVLCVMKEWCPNAGHHTASADLGEIAVDKAFLHVFHLAPIDALGAGIVAVRQELRLDGLRQFDRARRTQVSVGPDRLPLVGQEIVQHLFGLVLVRRVLDQTGDIGKHYRALARDHEFKIALLRVF